MLLLPEFQCRRIKPVSLEEDKEGAEDLGGSSRMTSRTLDPDGPSHLYHLRSRTFLSSTQIHW